MAAGAGVFDGLDSLLQHFVCLLKLPVPALPVRCAGSAIGAAPAANAEPPNTNCIAGRMNADGSCYYKNCTEAKANSESNIPEGSPHYCSKQDRDGDGIACEC